MKAGFNSKRLFGITRSKGKMYEFGLDESWTDPTTVDISCPHDEACSKASGLTPPRWL